MTNHNEVISKARGECISKHTETRFGGRFCANCGKQVGHRSCFSYTKDYDSNPSAWTPELYQWIGDAGLKDAFIGHLKTILNVFWPQASYEFDLLKATPPQKAQALAKAIKERG